jgi:hypothetical protein
MTQILACQVQSHFVQGHQQRRVFGRHTGPSCHSEMWMIGKPVSIWRHAATIRCDVFSSASSRGFTPPPRLGAVATVPCRTLWHAGFNL